MTPERTVELFQCVRMHLTSEKYDFLRYNGKKKKSGKPTNLSFAFFLANKFKKEEDFVRFLTANNIQYFKENNKVCSFIGEFANKDAIELYEKYEDFLSQRTYYIENDLGKLFSEKEKLKDFDFLFSKVLRNEISLYTIIYLNSFTNLKTHWQGSILYDEYELFLKKVPTFLEMHKENFLRSIVKVRDNIV